MGDDRRRYPITGMVLASVSWHPQGALRVDFAEGEPLVILVEDDGTILECLRCQIWDYDTALRLRAPPLLAVPEMSPVLMAEAEVEWNTAERLLTDAGESTSIRREAARSMMRARELRHQATVDGVRSMRRSLLAGMKVVEEREGAP
jgi:hypothetical protein